MAPIYQGAVASEMTSKKKVLLVRLDAIGDFVVWLGTAEALRTLYPPETHHITLLANEVWSDLARRLSWWDEVWPVDRARFRKRRSFYSLRLRWQIFRRRFDIALQPTYSREKNVGDLAIRATRAKERIGSAGDLSNVPAHKKQRTDRWYTRLIPATATSLTELERNVEFVRGLGATDFQPHTLALRELASHLTFAELPSAPYFVIVPGASNSIRRWSPENFAEIARLIVKRTGWIPVLSGSTEEKVIGQAVLERLQMPVVNLMGKTGVDDVLVVLHRARLLVANETAAVHIAAAVGTPAICIAGGGHWGRFVPYTSDGAPVEVRTVTKFMPCFHCNWTCIYSRPGNGPAPCVANVEVESVRRVVEEFLQN